MRLWVVSVLLAGSAHAETLHLTCQGGGTAIYYSRSTSRVADADGQEVGQVRSETGARESFGSDAEIEINDSGGRIRLPNAIIPTLHGGSGGWFELRDLAVNERQISAKAAVNILNKPNIRIDRYAATISIEAKGGRFYGTCKPFNPESEQRKF